MLYSVFRLFDENGNQHISINEFKAGLKELNIKVSASDVQEMFSSLDSDKSGLIDFNEFLAAMKVRSMKHSRPKAASTYVTHIAVYTN